ncbi:DUF4401 domain-containing protein [Chitiniphilus purpureus]|uniref:DUF4401 domain-containing protein n=1 Tax=Chitiniphilus purpureus TaxID=2981137 RepID=A0ABY6DI38_9NEIS|nr:DUF4401 domain-containing protein [Chitiniphilus sp. CD1]UXY13893.1 DUF4401 domain-containing protein [Chitiniphilus sp. CD1]
MKTWDEVTTDLLASGALKAAQLPPDDVDDLPWPTQLIQAIAAWIASALVLGAVMLAVADAPAGQVAAGGLLLAGAGVLLHAQRTGFLAQAGVPLALAGAFAIPSGLEVDWAFWDWICLAIGLGLFWLAEQRLLRLICTLLVLGVLWYWLTPLGWDQRCESNCTEVFQFLPLLLRQTLFGLALWWLWTRPPRRLAIWLPLRQALLLFWVVASWVTPWAGFGWSVGPYPTAHPAVGLLWALPAQLPLLLAVHDAWRRDPQAVRAVWPLLALLPLALLSPLLSLALLLLWLGLAEGRAVLLGLGSVVGISGFAQYYYSLHLPLLVKGLMLIAAGALLLWAWALLRRSA